VDELFRFVAFTGKEADFAIEDAALDDELHDPLSEPVELLVAVLRIGEEGTVA
jgi:hypothetical protein